jgi:DNA-binding NarL/FixJ family response regulator
MVWGRGTILNPSLFNPKTMEQHCIIGENTLLSKGLQHYLEFQRKATVSLISLKDLKLLDAGFFKSPNYLWLDVIPEMSLLLSHIKSIYQKEPKSKVFVFGEFKEAKSIKEILRAGVAGYFLPNCGIKQIKEAIVNTDSGSTYLDPQLSKIFVQELLQSSPSSEAKHNLTKREKQILQLIVEEHTTQEIANKLFISFCTVETHRLHLIQKMGVRNTAGLVREAVSSNLLG